MTNQSKFSPVQSFKPLYQPQLNYLLKRDNIKISYSPGQQKNALSQKPYTPGKKPTDKAACCTHHSERKNRALTPPVTIFLARSS